MHVPQPLLVPLRELGASHFSIVLNMVSDRGYRVYCDYPQQWLDLYFRQMLYLCDPVFFCAPHLEDATTWTEIAAEFPTDHVVRKARDFGLDNGMTIPVDIGDDRHLVSVTLDDVETPSRSHRDALVLAARELVATLADMADPEVSRFQSRVLFLQEQGLSTAEIVRIISGVYDGAEIVLGADAACPKPTTTRQIGHA
ncbi:MAG: autoinducer binding domain-containing protein [Paracoccaceae bacterium]